MKKTQAIIQTIHEYLQKEFPSAKHVESMEDRERLGHKFIITTKDHVMIASISRKFIDDTDLKTAILELNDIEIINLLKKNPDSTIVVRGKSYREPFFKIVLRNRRDCL